MILLAVSLLFYGLAFDPATTNFPAASRIAPINAICYKMVQPDGEIRYLTADTALPGVILGKRPWLGTIQKNVITVWADPEIIGGGRQTAFTFVNGQLRKLFLDGTDYKFPAGIPRVEGTLASLWPEKKLRTYAKGSAADIWRNDTRLRLWFANPNSAGMLCAQIALLGLWLLLAGCCWPQRCVGGALSAISLYGVAATGSRGALLGLIVGAGLMVAFALRRRPSKGIKTMSVAVIGIALATFSMSGFAKRLTGTIGHIDPGNQRRIKIAKASARMFADAPFGWRGGEVPGRHAALNWYVYDDNHVIRTHLLTMAELGWPVGFCYVFFWTLMTATGMAMARRGAASTDGGILLGEWSSFAAAGMFNPVYAEASLWIVPLAAAAWGIWKRRENLTPRTLYICGAVSAGFALTAVISMIGIGHSLNAGRKTSVRAVGRAAVVNGKTPAIWIVEDAPVLGGWGFPGREALAQYAKHPEAPALGYVAEVRDLPKEVDWLVLPGRAAAEYLDSYRHDPDSVCHAKKILFLSPSVMPDKMDERLLKRSKVQWRTGSLAICHEDVHGPFPSWVKIMLGVEQYVPNWMQRVVGEKF